MDINVIHHHIHHPNGFNPGYNLPPSLNSLENWHLYHHSVTDPSFNPNTRFDPLRLLRFWLKSPAPIYQYTFIHAPSMTTSEKIQKAADVISKEHLIPQPVAQESEKNKQELPDPAENKTSTPQQPPKVTEEPIKEKPVEEQKTAISLQNPFPTIIPEETNKQVEEILTLIRNGKTALNKSFEDLEQKNVISNIFNDILVIRQAYWNELAKKVTSSKEYQDFRTAIEKQKNFDTVLALILNDEADAAEKQKTSLKSPLGLISSYQNQDVFSYRLGVLREKDNLPVLSEEEEKEINAQMIEILVTLEKKENAAFIDSLSKMEERFAARGYTSVSDHYKTMILKFKQIVETLTHQDTENYIEEWNALLKEFNIQHQLFLKLHHADLTLETFAATVQKQLDALEVQKAGQTFQEINNMTGFMKGREALKSSIDVGKYIQDIYSFIEKAKVKLK